MRPRQPVPEALHNLALLQDGVVTREQALGLGLSRHAITRLANRDSWLRLTAGVYQTLPGAPAWPAVAWAGVLIGGDRARLAGQAAATLCGLRESPPDIVEILVPAGGGCPRLTGPWRFRRETPGARLARTVGSPPRITVEDLVLDLAAGSSDVRPGIGWLRQRGRARHPLRGGDGGVTQSRAAGLDRDLQPLPAVLAGRLRRVPAFAGAM
jgi:hypothetical protein